MDYRDKASTVKTIESYMQAFDKMMLPKETQKRLETFGRKKSPCKP